MHHHCKAQRRTRTEMWQILETSRDRATLLTDVLMQSGGIKEALNCDLSDADAVRRGRAALSEADNLTPEEAGGNDRDSPKTL